MRRSWRNKAVSRLNSGALDCSVNFEAEPFSSVAGTNSEVENAGVGERVRSEARGQVRKTPKRSVVEDEPRPEKIPVTLPTLRFMRELPEDWLK